MVIQYPSGSVCNDGSSFALEGEDSISPLQGMTFLIHGEYGYPPGNLEAFFSLVSYCCCSDHWHQLELFFPCRENSSCRGRPVQSRTGTETGTDKYSPFLQRHGPNLQGGLTWLQFTNKQVRSKVTSYLTLRILCN